MADISDLLEDVGLDPDYWISVLKGKLGIVNKASLKHLNPNLSLQQLQSAECIRHYWEESALLDLFSKCSKNDKVPNMMNETVATMLNQGIEAAPEIKFQDTAGLTYCIKQISSVQGELNESAETHETDVTIPAKDFVQTVHSDENVFGTSSEELVLKANKKTIEHVKKAKTDDGLMLSSDKDVISEQKICTEVKDKSESYAVESQPKGLTEDLKEDLESHRDSTRKYDNQQGNVDEAMKPQQIVLEENSKELGVQSSFNEAEVRRKAFDQIINRLKLAEYHSKRIHMSDVLVINELSVGNQSHITEEQLWVLFVQKLIMLDYNARYIVANKDVDEAVEHAEYWNRDADEYEDSDDILEAIMSKSEQSITTDKNKNIHPMDLQMAVFHCSDNFVKRYLFGKLATCQYAVPLIVPHPCSDKILFNLWACRSIKIFVLSSDNNRSEKEDRVDENVSDKPRLSSATVEQVQLPVVSFMRLGSLSASKSQMLNLILNKQKHDTFFNRQCQGYSADCSLMKGVVDIAWYIASGKKEDTFDSCISFTNLHGDAILYPKQVEFLQEISSVIVILMAMEEMQKYKEFIGHFTKNRKPLILLITDKDAKSVAKGGGKVITIPIKNRNEHELHKEVATAVKQLLKINDMQRSLEDIGELALNHGMLLDEDETNCKEAKSQAISVMKCLQSKDPNSLKSTFLPLQGKLWRDWCEKDKSLNNLQSTGNESLEVTRSKIETEKTDFRAKQKEKAFPFNEFMGGCIDGMSNISVMYFVQWLSTYLEALFNKDCHEDCSFGIEHILREIGQMYEAAESKPCQDTERSRGRLVEVATNLFLQGYPMELMDGDVAHVPLKWVTAILGKANETIKDEKVFVLSVLGLQSSGKSTLLNATFGVQFAVSAGRCTRGAYMQLLRVSDNLKKQLGFSYVLIVDTEGLRSIELINKTVTSHDNELAAFVIGLANITLINIFGENPSEMQDILQISVQAFLRMKEVNLHPSCVFVYQNVEDITAHDKMKLARNNLQKLLNDMTSVAAKEENRNVANFSDVIRFNIDKDTRYFSHLWDGNPPMAPPNPNYSENVQDLKSYLFSSCDPDIYQNVLTLSQFKKRVEDLWNALLCENFVFNFKNSMEIAEYNTLETEFQNWAWELRQCANQIEDSIKISIENKTYATETAIINCMEISISGKFDELLQKVATYFNEENKKNLRVQWKNNTEGKFRELKEDLVRKIKKKSFEDLEIRKIRDKLDLQNEHYEKQLLENSKILASKLKNEAANEFRIKEEFDKLWKDMLDKIPVVPYEKIDILGDIQHILIKSFETQHGHQKFVRQYKDKEFKIDTEKHVEKTRWYKKLLGEVTLDKNKKSQPFIERHIHQTQLKISEYVSSKERDKNIRDYSSQYVHEIIKRIKIEINKFNEDHKDHEHFKLTNQFIFEFTVHVCLNLSDRFIGMRIKYMDKNSPKTYFNSKRDKYFKRFQMYCKDASEIEVFVGLLISGLENGIRTAVLHKLCTDIANKMRCENKALNQNRTMLEYAILKDLAHKMNFDSFMEYINTPVDYMNNFIKGLVDEFCEKRASDVQNMLGKRLNDLNNEIVDAVEYACEKTSKENGDLNHWFLQFHCNLSEKVIIEKQTISPSGTLEQPKLLHLKNTICKELAECFKNIETKMKNSSINLLISGEHELHPAKQLSDIFKGCGKQCPFCGTLCTNTLPQHDEHSAPYHRPEAVKGWHYHKTEYFGVDICTSLISSDCSFLVDGKSIPYKNYKDGGGKYAEWSIKPDGGTMMYWKWFVNQFKVDLQNHFNLKFEDKGKIPDAWTKYTKEDAVKEIDGL